MDRLADEALRATSFKWSRPEPPVETGEDDGPVEDEAELNLDKVEEEMAADYSDEEDDDDILHINELTAVGASGGGGSSAASATAAAAMVQRPEEILQSNTDAEEWKLEVERVAPQLKVTGRGGRDGGDTPRASDNEFAYHNRANNCNDWPPIRSLFVWTIATGAPIWSRCTPTERASKKPWSPPGCTWTSSTETSPRRWKRSPPGTYLGIKTLTYLLQ